MQGPRACPYCDHNEIKPMPERRHESDSGFTWYECLPCRRIWASPNGGSTDFGRRRTVIHRPLRRSLPSDETA